MHRFIFLHESREFYGLQILYELFCNKFTNMYVSERHDFF